MASPGSFTRMAAILLAPALLLGCATPQQSCIAQVTRDYRAQQKAIEVAQGNIARGYAIHTQQVPYTVQEICHRKDPQTGTNIPYSCPQTRFRTVETPVAIDVAQERAKLAEYRRTLPQLEKQVQAGITQCQVQFPE